MGDGLVVKAMADEGLPLGSLWYSDHFDRGTVRQVRLEVLVEGQAERTALEPILTKILGPYGSRHTWRISKHRGIGELPEDPSASPNLADPTLLHNLPAKLRAYGTSLSDDETLLVLLDLDDRDCVTFR